MTRVSAPAPYGSLLKQAGSVKTKLKSTVRSPREKDTKHLEAVRLCPCLSCGKDIGCEAAHVRMASAEHGKKTGIGEKPDDKFALPLCTSCHAEQHRVSELHFWHALSINPVVASLKLYEASPDIDKMRGVILKMIAPRR